MENTAIPDDLGSWGSFNELREENNTKVIKVIDNTIKNEDYPADSDQKKAANFYSVGMDSARAEKVGLTPLQPFFDHINAISNADDLIDYIAYEETYGGGSFFGFGVQPSLKNSNINAAYLSQGGLGLPDPDYYNKTDDKSIEIQNKYKIYISNILVIKGDSPEKAEQDANAIYQLESDLASASMNVRKEEIW